MSRKTARKTGQKAVKQTNIFTGPGFGSYGVRAAASRSGSVSRALIWVDMEPLLSAERAKCRKAREKLETVKKQVDEFRALDEPAHAQWFHSHFGPELTECREMEARYMERANLIRDVRVAAVQWECSEREAYQRVMKRRSREAEGAESEQTSFEFTDSDGVKVGVSADDVEALKQRFGVDPSELNILRLQFEDHMGSGDGWEEEYEMLFAEYVAEYKAVLEREAESAKRRAKRDERGGAADSAKDGTSRDAEEFVPKERRPENPEQDQIKSIYRLLARKLHPDANPNLTAAEKALWYDVQAAYEDSDLMRLESLLAMVDQDAEGGSLGASSSGKRGIDGVDSVSRLRLMFKDVDKKLRALRKQLRSLEQHPAWEFRVILQDPKRLKKRISEVRRDLRYDFEEMHSGVMEMDDLVESWSRQRPRARGRR